MPLPRFILEGEYSINAKLLYALLLGRTQLSQKSGWVSEDENVYVIYTIDRHHQHPAFRDAENL